MAWPSVGRTCITKRKPQLPRRSVARIPRPDHRLTACLVYGVTARTLRDVAAKFGTSRRCESRSRDRLGSLRVRLWLCDAISIRKHQQDDVEIETSHQYARSYFNSSLLLSALRKASNSDECRETSRAFAELSAPCPVSANLITCQRHPGMVRTNGCLARSEIDYCPAHRASRSRIYRATV